MSAVGTPVLITISLQQKLDLLSGVSKTLVNFNPTNGDLTLKILPHVTFRVWQDPPPLETLRLTLDE